MNKGYHKPNITLCWTCQNAVPTEDRGCSWSRFFKPVKGSRVILSRVEGAYKLNFFESYAVLECPEYKREEENQYNEIYKGKNMKKIIIDGRLPGINELVGQGHWAVYAKKKKTSETTVMWAIKAARVPVYNNKVTVKITCYEPNQRRDHDNVMGGAAKIILDALKKSSVIIDDSPKWCKVEYGGVYVDKDRPRIEIEISDCIDIV